MSSEKILIKFFSQIKPEEFKRDTFLESVYQFYVKEKYITDPNNKSIVKLRENPPNLFTCYMDYLLRNKEFNNELERNTELKNIYSEITEMMLYGDPDKEVESGFLSKEEKEKSKQRFKNNRETETKHEKVHDPSSKKIVLDKKKALKVLSVFIQQSIIVTYENPDLTATEDEERTREQISSDILNDVKKGTTFTDIKGVSIDEKGRELPVAKPDEIFRQRNEMMNIWRDTESKCQELLRQQVWETLLTKLYFIDTKHMFEVKSLGVIPDKIETIFTSETSYSLPREILLNSYTGGKYKTVIRLSNEHPINDYINVSKNKEKCIYICTGSQMVIGGNADQGIDCNESMLYMISTYSAGISKALHAYPLNVYQALLCRNVLVFKDFNYKIKPVQQWQRIAVLTAPVKFRPNLVSTKKDDIDIYARETNFKKTEDADDFKNSLIGSIETCLFFGYDTIILDDRAIEDNRLPAYAVMRIMYDVLHMFNGRVREFIISINKSKSFNVFREKF